MGDKPEIHSNLVFELGAFKEERASRVALVVKNSPASAGDVRDMGSIPGSGRFPRWGGHGNPLLKIPWTEELGGLQPTELQKVEHD